MNTTDKKKSFLDSFKINDPESCAKAIKTGGIAAMISAALTGIFGIIGLFTSSSNKNLNYLLDPWILVDVALIIVLGIFIFRKSRTAATLLILHFVSSKLIMWSDLGEPKGLFMSLIFLFFYGNAMRGTYLWHAKYLDMPAKAECYHCNQKRP